MTKLFAESNSIDKTLSKHGEVELFWINDVQYLNLIVESSFALGTKGTGIVVLSHMEKYTGLNDLRATGLQHALSVTLKTSARIVVSESSQEKQSPIGCSYLHHPHKESGIILRGARGVLSVHVQHPDSCPSVGSHCIEAKSNPLNRKKHKSK